MDRCRQKGSFNPMVAHFWMLILSNAKSWGPLWGSDLVIDSTLVKNTWQQWKGSRSGAFHLISRF